MSDFTLILQQIEGGDLTAAEQFLPFVYEQLRIQVARDRTGKVIGNRRGVVRESCRSGYRAPRAAA